MKAVAIGMLVIAVALVTGCSMTSRASDFSGLTTPDGTAVHLNTTNYAIHWLFAKPLLGDASLQRTVRDCTGEAKSSGASKVRLVQSSRITMWWILPPISFVVHPVITNVAADAIQ